jgi:transposase
MNVTAHDPSDLDQLRRRIAREANAKQRDRWRAVLLALEGEKTKEIMDKLDRSKNFVQRWVYFYRDHGLERVRPLKQPGKSPHLPREQHQAFLDRINNSEQNLRGRDIVRILKEQFGVSYSLNGAYQLLHRLGYEPLRPRPVNPKKQGEDEQQWIESAPFLSGPSASNSPTGRSNSGSRMNADSDRRGA